MVKKVKGLNEQNPQLQKTHKFSKSGDSQLGSSPDHKHTITGSMNTSGSLTVDGQVELSERLSGFLFSPPHIDGAETDKVNE